MLNPSMRRAARACPNGHSLRTRPTTASIAPFTSQSHQRRHSSSKPPVPPNNGSPAIPATSVKQVGASRSESKKPATESRLSKRKAAKPEAKEEVFDNWAATLPSVPSLQHLNQKDVNIAAFYATYRPISITGPGPKESQLEDVEKLFAARPKAKFKPPPSEVIYTLSSALEGLNEAIADKQVSQQDSTVTQKVDLIKSLTQHNDHKITHLDGQQTLNVRVPSGTVKLVLQEIQNRFRPFNIPPAPAPVSQQEIDAIDAENAASEANEELLARDLESQVEQQEVQSAVTEARKVRRELEIQIAQQGDNADVAEVVLNVRNNLSLQDGQFFTPRITIEDAARVRNISDPSPRIRVGNRRRRGVSIPLRKKPSMLAISVKRQRRLKMKKHKYRKLMRRTRNLRKRQDKL